MGIVQHAVFVSYTLPPTTHRGHDPSVNQVQRATSDTRARVIPDMLNVLSQYFPSSPILNNSPHTILTQFILDPTSLNLPESAHVTPNHPALPAILT